MESLKLRKANQHDEEFAYQVKRATMKEYVELAWGWNEDQQRQLHGRRFREQDFRIIEMDGEDVGIMSVDLQPDCMFVNQVYILPDYQGRKIGRMCMKMIMRQAADLGLLVRLKVLKVNVRALTFYKRLGFTITNNTDTHFLMKHVERPP